MPVCGREVVASVLGVAVPVFLIQGGRAASFDWSKIYFNLPLMLFKGS